MDDPPAPALDPQVKALLAQFEAAAVPSLATLSVGEAREAVAKFVVMQGQPEPVPSVTDRTVPGPAGDIPVRVYHPDPERAAPVLVWYHGGGFVVGDLDVSDRPCRALAVESGCVVVSVDYRLAPEHPYPAAPDDAYAALAWVAANAGDLGGDPARLAVGGDSAGGNLAAVVSLMSRDRGGPPITLQLLVYPATDLLGDTPSRRENAEGYLLTTAEIEWFMGHYLPDGTVAGEPYCSPLLAGDHSGLPPALIVTAGFDPLRDEGEAYADALRAAGGKARLMPNPTMVHGFLWMAGVVQHTATAYREIGEAVRHALRPDTPIGTSG